MRGSRSGRGVGRREFAGQRVFITGAGGGIGGALAERAAAQGALLFLTDCDEDRLAATATRVRAAGGTVVHTAPADIRDHEAVRALAAATHARGGPMDIVMNVAGVSAWGTVRGLEHRHWRTMVEVNLMGPIHVIEEFVPSMIDAGRGGHLVNVSSAAGLLGLPWHAAYSAGKFGLRGVSEVLRFDLRRHRIGVSLVCPGAVDTPLTETVEIVGVDPADPAVGRLRRRFRRYAATPDEVAVAVLDGVRRNRYLVHTSSVVRFAHGTQRLCPPLYACLMRLLNRRAHRVLEAVAGSTR
ncbi:SDR family oxidoreductase [Streptomyces boluensis]|uniref:SDR family oxidoreductase n=1 Tax=Streptomyces boluensis TaxID=1775135 RepID=A0A964XQM7_9ACTN|nr:SDR family oxidoreductase [Streptomyces boluensis]NBE56451.1 SDR family oxidoreductase [Streptomyces boluensis]